MVMPIQFQFNREVDNDFVHHIMQTACEGGSIEYWCNPDEDDGEYQEIADDGQIIEFRVKVDIEPIKGFEVKQTIDGAVIRAGIERLLTGAVEVGRNALGRLLWAILNDDAGECIDGDLVDSIVQAGLYNDIVFG